MRHFAFWGLSDEDLSDLSEEDTWPTDGLQPRELFWDCIASDSDTGDETEAPVADDTEELSSSSNNQDRGQGGSPQLDLLSSTGIIISDADFQLMLLLKQI